MSNDVKKKFYQKWWFSGIIGIVAIVAIVAIVVFSRQASKKYDKKMDATKPTSNTAKTADKKKENSKITYENFAKVQLGTKYEDVASTLGEGNESNPSEKDGIRSSTYTWNGKNESRINIVIQNGVVTSKEQSGLNSGDAKVSLEKYNQVKEGMTYNEVKKIAGEGQIVSQIKITSIETVVFMYNWVNKDGSKMSATFTAGKLSAKTQFNLK